MNNSRINKNSWNLYMKQFLHYLLIEKDSLFHKDPITNKVKLIKWNWKKNYRLTCNA